MFRVHGPHIYFVSNIADDTKTELKKICVFFLYFTFFPLKYIRVSHLPFAFVTEQ